MRAALFIALGSLPTVIVMFYLMGNVIAAGTPATWLDVYPAADTGALALMEWVMPTPVYIYQAAPLALLPVFLALWRLRTKTL